MSYLEGIKTDFFTDVKVPIRAGMEFGTKNYKIRHKAQCAISFIRCYVLGGLSVLKLI